MNAYHVCNYVKHSNKVLHKLTDNSQISFRGWQSQKLRMRFSMSLEPPWWVLLCCYSSNSPRMAMFHLRSTLKKWGILIMCIKEIKF